MALSKQQRCAGMKRTRLRLEKIKILNYSNENPKKLQEKAVQFQIGKTVPSSILKDGKKLHKELEFFKGNCKTKRAGQFSLRNTLQVIWKMLRCRHLPAWINVTGRGVENKRKLKSQFIGQFYSLQWLIRKMENRVWYSRNAYYWGNRQCFNPHCEILDRKNT